MMITNEMNTKYGCEYCLDRDGVHKCKHNECPYKDEIGEGGYESYVNGFKRIEED